MRKIEIVCPFHKKREEIEIPDNYAPNFAGDIICVGGPDTEARARLHISLEVSKTGETVVRKLRLVEKGNESKRVEVVIKRDDR